MVVAESAAEIGEPPRWSKPLGKRIGAGGFAAVWEIDDGAVLKVAHADHELARARLGREAEALAAIGAPAVPRIDGHGVLADGRAWIAMERVTGESIGDLIAKGSLRADEVVGFGAAIADSLARFPGATQRRETRSLPSLNMRGILYPVTGFVLQIYSGLPKDFTAPSWS